jgi:two-component system LytT family response regulator
MKILIVDDEQLASSRLQRLLEELKYQDITVFNDTDDVIEDLKSNSYDLVFLDIQMPKITGIELANIVLEYNPKSFIIFQTAYSEYALDAFKVGGFDYLLKPVSTETLSNSIEKVKKYLSTNVNEITNKKIMGKSGSKIYLIELDDIYYIQADLDEIIIRIKDADIYVRKKIGHMQKQLEGKNFFRIHRSIIVNVDKIKSMESIEQSKLQISFDDIDNTVTSSKEGAKEFREFLDKQSL